MQVTRKNNMVNGLSFPFETVPLKGEMIEVADSVFWTRAGLPMPGLDHINLYVIGHNDGYSIVDTGMKIPDNYDHWNALFEGPLSESKIHAVYVTHMHPDHVGLAGWLTRRHQCMLYMSRAEYLHCRTLSNDTGREAPKAGIDFFTKAGFSDKDLQSYKDRFGFFGKVISTMPDNYNRLIDGQKIRLGDAVWEVITGEGHSPEHVCFYDHARKILISGDQVLPKISSNVSVHPTEPNANPLLYWLNSCRKIKGRTDAETLVLPSHNEPFFGLHTRLDQLIQSHERSLNRLKLLLADRNSAIVPDCFSVLFKRKVEAGHTGLATGETIAHLNYLRFTDNDEDRVVRNLDNDGRYEYKLESDPSQALLEHWQAHSQKGKLEGHYV